MLTANEALGILEGNGSLDISVEMSVIERKIKDAIKEEQYEVLIDFEEMTPVRRRKALLTLDELGYRKYHTGGYRWIIGWL
jgi:mRNA-degrading endonuclease RelE of RelBE toxin-antitoxin system